MMVRCLPIFFPWDPPYVNRHSIPGLTVASLARFHRHSRTLSFVTIWPLGSMAIYQAGPRRRLFFFFTLPPPCDYCRFFGDGLCFRLAYDRPCCRSSLTVCPEDHREKWIQGSDIFRLFRCGGKKKKKKENEGDGINKRYPHRRDLGDRDSASVAVQSQRCIPSCRSIFCFCYAIGTS
ncbi:hypothetical protein M426DRAFT_172648 [Hypoxylon sp. CI-4A]|nr:hypothetical protein M426DRAFT_172648 [Hypoxylon sp. CI-4A]